METVFHIGFPKCASTFLQKNIFSMVTSRLLVADGRALRFLADDGYRPEEFRSLVMERWGPGEGLSIFSHEVLTGDMLGCWAPDPLLLARRVHQAFPEARVVVIFREPFSYLLSLYCYRVQRFKLEYRTLDGFLEHFLPRGLLWRMEFGRVVEAFAKVFPAERLLARPMELPSERLVAEVESFLERRCPGPVSYQPVNVTTKSALANGVLRLINYPLYLLAEILIRAGVISSSRSIYKRVSPSHRALAAAIGRRAPAELAISPRWKAELAPLIARSNALLEEHSGVELAPLGYLTQAQ